MRLQQGAWFIPARMAPIPRILGRYVRENGWMTLEDAVRKASSAVADRLGLRDRGLLRDGMVADVWCSIQKR